MIQFTQEQIAALVADDKVVMNGIHNRFIWIKDLDGSQEAWVDPQTYRGVTMPKPVRPAFRHTKHLELVKALKGSA